VLWRELCRGQESRHRAALGKAFLDILQEPAAGSNDLPERVSVFGISALPVFYLRILEAVSDFTEVNLFLMNPCKEYWGDILSDRGIKAVMEREAGYGLSEEELYLERGNGLLASMGTLGRDFFYLVNELSYEEIPRFEEPGQDTLLSCIQSDILNLENRGQPAKGKKTLRKGDKSIQIHSCHSPMREMEVLYDVLLDMFERDSTLLPRDVIVMTPDIETYAPYIQAVFGVVEDDRKKIPFTIADQSIRRESSVVDTFLSILGLCGTRFVAADILTILESPAVQRQFGFAEADLELILKWVTETRIRWGIDEQSRSELGLPSFRENTWKGGLERLLLGYAMPGKGENMFEEVLPYDHIEGSEAMVLGNFLDFTEELFNRVTSFKNPRDLNQWSEDLTKLLDGFFLPDEDTEVEIQAIRPLLRELRDLGEEADFTEKVGVNVIRCLLGHHLEKQGSSFGFITGGVTFCAMLPMRSIPFRVTCLVGMDGDAYPRESRPLGFDLIATHTQRGDRSRRNDDRYLFLEAILSAREKLYISYVGQSIQDNSPMPPSVLVSELTDYTEQGFEISEGAILTHILTKHRLQAFSPEYFKDDETLFSYSEENFRVAQCGLEPREDRQPLIVGTLSEPGVEWKTVDLHGLCRFWSNPARFLLTHRLGIYLEERGPILEETEPLEVAKLEKYLLEEVLVDRRLTGVDLKTFMPMVRASGELPHGVVGECLYGNLCRGVENFVPQIEKCAEGEELTPLEVDLEVNGFRLTGRVAGIYPNGLLQYRYARVKPKDHLRLWIHHLVLNATEPASYPRTSRLAALHQRSGQPFLWEYIPLRTGKVLLGNLLEKYWLGLTRPLHFFPESSWNYMQLLGVKNKSEEEALRGARNSWTGSDFSRGESKDLYYQLCFQGTHPLGEEFHDQAIEVLGPLLEHLRELDK
jgi:exodeoxyribonuclease V gamma subunit